MMKSRIKQSIGITILSCMSCITSAQVSHESINDIVQFSEVATNLPTSKKNLRKWDSPVIADLDQDGYDDLILNDHGYGIQICWNNQGYFSKPYDVLIGDVHGVAVADFNSDGLMDMILSRGGGSGSNARNAKRYTIEKNRTITAQNDFSEPLAMMRGRTVAFYDGDNDGDEDLINFAFPSKEYKGKSENYIYQNTGSELLLKDTLPAIKSNGQMTLITDWNNDGVLDLALYGQGKIKCYQGLGDMRYKEQTTAILPQSYEDVTNVHEVDFDNDGDFDLYLTRGKEHEKGETFYDAKRRLLGFHTRRGSFDFNHIKTGDILQFTNYHTQWPYINQLYIGESAYDYEHPGELHSGKDIRLVNSNALGFPDQLNDQGIHIGYIGNQEWRIAGNTHSAVTGVIHDVDSWEESHHEKGLTDILLENKKGRFIDITKESGLYLAENTNVAISTDVNNDGWIDIIIVPRGNFIDPINAIVFINQNGSQFEQVEKHGLLAKELGSVGLALASIDYDRDGDLDIITGHERGQWHLYENNTPNTKQSLVVQVGRSPVSLGSPLHAVVTVDGCDLKQSRRVGASSAMYSQSYTTEIPFGIGECDQTHNVKVRWTNGEQVSKKIKKGKRIKIGE